MDGHARWRSRVRGLPETLGDLPAACLAEEIETPGSGQVRALVTYAGNPVLSTPNGRRLAAALARLEFMVSIDLYVNETTSHADLILPPAWALAEDHLDLLFPAFAVRNTVRYSPPVVTKGEGELHDWEILLELVLRLGGGPTGTPALDALLRLLGRFGWRFRPTAMAELLLRTGRHGDRFLPWRRGLDLRTLAAEHPHGKDWAPSSLASRAASSTATAACTSTPRRCSPPSTRSCGSSRRSSRRRDSCSSGGARCGPTTPGCTTSPRSSRAASDVSSTCTRKTRSEPACRTPRRPCSKAACMRARSACA
jgi:hypothetical protein